MQREEGGGLEGFRAHALVCRAFAKVVLTITLHLNTSRAMCSGERLEAWKVAAKDGEVLNRKQEPMDSPLRGPLQSKGDFVYALSKEGFWLCSMPLSGTGEITSYHVTSL